MPRLLGVRAHRLPRAAVPAGKRPEGELGNYWDALRPLRRLYGRTPAAKFGPVKLAAVRDEMIRLGWCRNHINRNVARLRHVFKWAVGAKLRAAAPASCGTGSGRWTLRKGRSKSRETVKVRPGAGRAGGRRAVVLSPQLRAMIDLQRLTGGAAGGEWSWERVETSSLPSATLPTGASGTGSASASTGKSFPPASATTASPPSTSSTPWRVPVPAWMVRIRPPVDLSQHLQHPVRSTFACCSATDNESTLPVRASFQQ